MNRLLVLVCVAAVAVLLAFHRPPAPAAAIAVAPSLLSQTSRKGHPARTAAAVSVVYVVGAVRRPGLYTVAATARINDAIQRAGGLLPAADSAAVNLAEHISDGAEVHVPRVGEATPAPGRRSGVRKTRPSPARDSIDLNAADAAMLASLPGIGETLAARIVEYRGLNGPFASLDELADVAGMTQRRIDAISPYLHVSSAR